MTSQDSDLLWSDAHGTYDISFLAASVRHDFSLSKHLDRKLTGGLLSAFSSAWAQCDPTEKKAYLLEQHELAHHALMYSTPAGVFNWRLNQTIFRDILFVLKKYKEASGHFPEFQSPRSFFNRVTWKGAFRADVDPQSARTKAYVIHTIEALEKLIQLRAIFFGNGAATKYSELTMGELVNLMNSSYAYLMDRCDCSLVRTWTTRLPANTKVFSPDKAFNVMDIAECHAISAELYHLRAFGDEAGLTARLEGAKKSAFRLAMSVAIDATKNANDLGYSPNQMQILSLLSCSASLDVVDDSATVRNLEDELPWWRFATKDIKSPETFHQAATNLQYLSTMQLAGQESKWFQYRMRAANKPRGTAPSNEDRSHVLSSLLSFGLELQVRAIHQGAVLNTRYLATLLHDNLKVSYPKDFVRLSHDDWANQLKHDIPLVEYNDNLRFRPTPLDDMYPPDSAVRQTMFFNEMEQESIQLLAVLLTGASARAAFAVYDKKSIPSSQVLQPKLESYFQQTEVAEGLVKVLANAFDHGQIFPIQRRHLRIMPPSAENNKYI